MQRIELTNGDAIVRGIAELHGKFTAHNGVSSKTFKTMRGAEKWLARFNLNADGKRVKNGAVFG